MFYSGNHGGGRRGYIPMENQRRFPQCDNAGFKVSYNSHIVSQSEANNALSFSHIGLTYEKNLLSESFIMLNALFTHIISAVVKALTVVWNVVKAKFNLILKIAKKVWPYIKMSRYNQADFAEKQRAEFQYRADAAD